MTYSDVLEELMAQLRAARKVAAAALELEVGVGGDAAARLHAVTTASAALGAGRDVLNDLLALAMAHEDGGPDERDADPASGTVH